MPIINIAVTGKPNPALSEKIAVEVTALTRRHLRKDPTVTAVAITYIDPEHWFAAGTSLAAQNADSFWLDIKVVDGTNTKQELATYLEEVFGFMRGALKNLHEESYILVHEVPASAYGYGGATQEFRFVSGQLKKAA